MRHFNFTVNCGLLLPYPFLCNPTNFIWRKGTPFETMTGCTAPSSDCLLAEVFQVFLSSKANARRSVHSPWIISLSPLSLVTNMTDATPWASGLWLGTQTGAGGTATPTKSFFGRSPWLHGQQVNK